MNPIRARGFTLIEMVVALTLLAVILAGLIGALATFARSASRIDERTLASDDVRLVYAFLSQSLGEASPRPHRRPEDSASVSWLQGDEAQLEWLGLMPARHGVGGLYHLRLRLAADGDLFLYYLPYAGDDPPPDWNAAAAHRLLRGLSGFAIAYRALDEPDWRPAWRDVEVLPARVRVALARPGEVWPELVVPVLAAEPLADVNRSARFGGMR
ncbi:prepilin-type N-terminal cleavage/methylation domain-containing protein [Immundisolibacter sp.]|uniref:prepilin-type N-terminal cleavage/methylation domain-containing protein n=1 Tax=Immundisolibacter sp. TaxID=1934948 RepID=UPI0026030FFC|nr:prepilin-type N-terminal cleavage/methylation domain-containing protein [Immundisolibacter sp.]MDD3650720.1 prepilin-type N-terminal cleavage/methylation domain-containing protein [Immundisolibacter sp.]